MQIKVLITTEQLTLLSRAIGSALAHDSKLTTEFTAEEIEELELLRGCCDDASLNPQLDVTYGFSL